MQSQPRTRIEQVDGGEAAVGDRDDAALGQPARRLQQNLPAPIGQLLVPLLALAGIAFGRRQDGQERQCPDAPGPWDLRQQHDREPSQAARFDEVAVRGADRIAIDAARFDLGTPAPLEWCRRGR